MPDQEAPVTDKVCEFQLTCEEEQFAMSLECARTLWRRYPELVEAEEWPSFLLDAARRGALTKAGTRTQ